MASEVEQSLAETASFFNILINEFTAPKLENEGNLPCHEWCVELETSDFNIRVSNHLNSAL